MRPLAREPLQGGAGGALHRAVQMDVGDASDAESLELVRKTGNGDVVPRDGNGRRLDEKPVAQGGGSEGAGGDSEKAATGEGKRHGGKVTSPGGLPVAQGSGPGSERAPCLGPPD